LKNHHFLGEFTNMSDTELWIPSCKIEPNSSKNHQPLLEICKYVKKSSEFQVVKWNPILDLLASWGIANM
jgi:hypothetical protein